METTADLSSLLNAETWDSATVTRVRREAFASGKCLEQFKAFVSEQASKDERTANLKAGVGLVLLGRYEEGLEQLKQASESETKRYFMGVAYRETGDFKSAVTDFERAESRGWQAVDCAMQTVETLRRSGEADAAGKLLNKHSKSDSPEVHYQRGCLLEQDGNFGEAMEAYQAALAVDEMHGGANFRLAYLAEFEGDDARAIDHYRRCVQTEPAPVNALINLAVLYEDQGNYNMSIRCLQEVLRVEPNHQRARLYLKDALAGLTQYYDEIQERARDKQTAVLEIPITDFELSVRSRNCLKKMNINTLGDLLRVSENELLSYKNFGETSLNEIKAMLSQKGLRLGQALEGDGATPLELGGDDADDDVLGKGVDELELSVRARRCLERLGVRTLGELANRTEAELMATKNFGVTSLDEIKLQLAEHGLSLRNLDD